MRRRYLIAYPIWNKRDMVPELMRCISENIDSSRAGVLFTFSNCTDDSIQVFADHLGILTGFEARSVLNEEANLWEPDQHNKILKYFHQWESFAQYDVVIIPQDDNFIRGKTLLQDLDKLLDQYGDGIGLIGGRDGYDFAYKNMAGSPFSASALCVRRLGIGEYSPCTMVNTGPLVYTRSVVEKVGYYDDVNKIYAMDDYALRARQAGLQNVVIGMDIEHKKYGACPVTVPDVGAMAAKDLADMNAKWTPILGRSVY